MGEDDPPRPARPRIRYERAKCPVCGDTFTVGVPEGDKLVVETRPPAEGVIIVGGWLVHRCVAEDGDDG